MCENEDSPMDDLDAVSSFHQGSCTELHTAPSGMHGASANRTRSPQCSDGVVTSKGACDSESSTQDIGDDFAALDASLLLEDASTYPGG